MFYKILISLILCIASLKAMDTEQSFPFQELPKDLQGLILAHAYKDHSDSDDAIQQFKKLVLVSKDTVLFAKNSIYTKLLMKDLVEKYFAPGILIPICLHSKKALTLFQQAVKKELKHIAKDNGFTYNNSQMQNKSGDADKFIETIFHGNTEAIIRMLRNGFNLNEIVYKKLKLTVFSFLFCDLGLPVPIIKLLLAADPNVNAQDRQGKTVLMGCASTLVPDWPYKLVVLLAVGAKIHAIDNTGNSALHYAISGAYHRDSIIDVSNYPYTAAQCSYSRKLLVAAGASMGSNRFSNLRCYGWLGLSCFKIHAQESACTIV